MTHAAFGSEYPTLVERFVGMFRMPYLVGCVVINVPLNVLAQALILYLGEWAAGPWSESVTALGGSLTYLAFVAAYYSPYYMRRKVVQAGTSISRLLAKGEVDYRRLFDRVSVLKPQIILFVLLIAFFVSITVLPNPAISMSALLGALIFFSFFGLGLSSTLWSYFVYLNGIRKIGNVPLQLRSCMEDSTLGLRPVGSLALSLVAAYLAFQGVFVVLALVVPPPPEVYVPLSLQVILGVALFILPLTGLHKRMLEQKRVERERIAAELAQTVRAPTEGSSQADVSRVLMLEMKERKVSSMAVWPFDTKILGKLSAIVLSLIAILLSRLIGSWLGI